ncbi:class I SAM-dependent methyltransferase [Cytobacillus purgationiresistens]|uniref:Ubiquinone/menaquinone biosynthesis C-methylase UbiE n=1 Tax=Cytobacillus purgationiresistens TaxID=863449 RepID=A0ABU0AH56_9BACI|nr:class I SAM-dependent methyltransferase [Cytobacillus purgationiresistens]MDQ0270596.1 ubiquinone/menaquinone biosynthesis C-methylase UbiE [Cytobacillus purgationiresistens]
MSRMVDYYNQFDEWGRLDREPIEFKVNWHYMKKHLPSSGHILDNGAGPGKYAMALAHEGYDVTLTDITAKLVQVAEEKADELNLLGQFNGFHSADARHLHMIEDEQFDASLMLGPLYHLQEEKDRNQALSELHRVTKLGGIIFVAFMPRIRHILTSLLSPEHWRPNNEIDNILHFTQTGRFNHSDEGRFTGAYYFEIEEIQPFMEQSGFETLELIGSNPGSILSDEQWTYWRDKGDNEINKIIELIKERAADPYILGLSSHLLYIGKKK